MKIKEIHTKAGSLTNYFGYIVILFCWYLLRNLLSSIQPESSFATVKPFLEWGSQILIGPLLFAGIFGSINERQKTQDLFEGGGFFDGVKNHFWRIFGANFLYMVTFIIIGIIAVAVTGYEQPSILENKVFNGVTSIFFSTINLFWYASIIIERKIFRGLLQSIKTLIFNPIALGIGVLWAIIGFSDTLFFDLSTEQIPLAINVIRSGVIAVLKVLSAMYALASYTLIWGKSDNETQAEFTQDKLPANTSGKSLINASFGLAFVSFIPLLNIVALVLGILTLRRENRFVLRAAIACCLGGFFTILYFFLGIALFIEKPINSMAPGYHFLTEVDTGLEPFVTLLENRETEEFQQKLNMAYNNSNSRPWEVDCASALARFQENDLENALADFQIAAGKYPERSEFYFYYGLTLLDCDQAENALEQFKNALRYDPDLQIAQRYITLIDTTYKPSTIVSSVMFVIILLILFTLHEFGHAYTAWKLGDDTAKNAGRLTLNPIRHLDVFGSIILPGILLFQGSESIFGWAKPVPVNPENLKNPQKDHMLVSFAGPAINLIVSMVCILLIAAVFLLVRILWPETLALNISAPNSSVSLVGPPFAREIVIFIVFMKQIFYTSLVLGVFNLIPIPPLDGSWIFAGLLPQGLREMLEKGRQFSYIIFLLLVISPVLDYFLMVPLGLAWAALQILALVMGLV